jgi:uncharacterized protein YndB with AHSA1/START domain
MFPVRTPMARALIGTAAAVAAVPPDRVWAVLVDAARRSEWDPNVDWAVVEGGLLPGSYLTIKPKRGLQTAYRLAIVERPARFALELTVGPLASLTLTWTIVPAPEGAQIEQRVELAGPLAALLRGMANRAGAAMPANLARLAELAASVGK